MIIYKVTNNINGKIYLSKEERIKILKESCTSKVEIKAFNLKDKFCVYFDSIKTASKILRISTSSIHQMLSGKSKTCAGFIFERTRN